MYLTNPLCWFTITMPYSMIKNCNIFSIYMITYSMIENCNIFSIFILYVVTNDCIFIKEANGYQTIREEEKIPKSSKLRLNCNCV